ncbi:hypothetical protein D6827_02895 [Candidatus Parcubacteria bacterium]|nr:MAG: hypothetical protein D6827_02895 [Candidatus Parcubacteria bacterium]
MIKNNYTLPLWRAKINEEQKACIVEALEYVYDYAGGIEEEDFQAMVDKILSLETISYDEVKALIDLFQAANEELDFTLSFGAECVDRAQEALAKICRAKAQSLRALRDN